MSRRNGSDLDGAKTEAQERARDVCVLVESGRDAERIGKREAEPLNAQAVVIGCREMPERINQRRQRTADAQCAQAEMMRTLRLDSSQERIHPFTIER
jgi:hypothetical protein